MKDEDNVGFDLLLRTFESVENPENTFASVDITQMSQLAKKQSKTLDVCKPDLNKILINSEPI